MQRDYVHKQWGRPLYGFEREIQRKRAIFGLHLTGLFCVVSLIMYEKLYEAPASGNRPVEQSTIRLLNLIANESS